MFAPQIEYSPKSTGLSAFMCTSVEVVEHRSGYSVIRVEETFAE